MESLLLALLLAARGPYVQDVRPDGFTVVVQPDGDGPVRIASGPPGALGPPVEAARDGRLRLARLTAPPGATSLAYRVEGDDAEHVVELPRPGPVKLCVIGDSGSGTPEQAAVAALLVREKPSLVLVAGDVVYPKGADADYDATFFAPYRALLPTVPFYPSLGNHDYMTEQAAPYLRNFVLPEGPGGERYYSFERGDLHVLALDSNLDLGKDGAQAKWIERDLAAAKAKVRLAFFHHPPFTSGPHGSDEASSKAVRENLVPLLAKGGVRIVIGGHDHHYERFGPLGGVTYFVTGGGGARLRPIERHAQTKAADDRRHHALCFDASASKVRFRAVATDGAVIDEGEVDLGSPLDPALATVLPAVAPSTRAPGSCGCTGAAGAPWLALLAVALLARLRSP